jgi:hypothetical protein
MRELERSETITIMNQVKKESCLLPDKEHGDYSIKWINQNRSFLIGPPGLKEGFDLLHGPDVVHMISLKIAMM